jgi:hypothetical protein
MPATIALEVVSFPAVRSMMSSSLSSEMVGTAWPLAEAGFISMSITAEREGSPGVSEEGGKLGAMDAVSA